MGEGSALGLGPAARSAAIQDAQTAIIIDRLDKIAPSRDFSIFMPVIQNAPAYFQSFKVLRESKTDDSTHVEIQGQLLERKFKREIASVVLSESFIPPRVIIIARETLPNVEPPAVAGIIEKKFHELLKRIDFELVPPELLHQEVPADRLEAFLGDNVEPAAMFARELLAHIVILAKGVTSVEPSSSSGNLDRVRATLDTRVVRAEDGFVLDAQTVEAVVHSADSRAAAVQAVEDACEKVADDLKTAIALGAIGGAPQNTLLVTIEGAVNEQDAAAAIEAIRKCLEVDQAEILHQEPKRVRVRFDYAGPIGTLADALPTIHLPFGMLTLRTVVDRDVVLRVDTPQ